MLNSFFLPGYRNCRPDVVFDFYSYGSGCYTDPQLDTIANGVCRFTPLGTNQPEELQFRIYPQPAATTLHIDLPTASYPTSIRIYSVSGSEAVEEQVQRSNGTVDISGIPAGIYIVKVKVGGGATYFRKIIRI